ncbi:hypothetical protein BKA70DRAFT_1442742 [Coprinopsis sp. MPI-PUGE-AT-0042]|nr:hypothetical protein BKA70DRAFT_1442742 [Coprinopsis sp. MPI-PUGE-AT-0042]
MQNVCTILPTDGRALSLLQVDIAAMDPLYDEAKARTDLDRVIEQRLRSKLPGEHMKQLIDLKGNNLTPQIIDGRGTWKLCVEEDAIDSPGEKVLTPALFRMQGILSNKLLPPVAKPQNRSAIMKSRNHMRQSVTITGMGSEHFDAGVGNTSVTHG